MPTISDIAICVRHWDYSETSQTVSLFGREHGMIRGLAKGAKRDKGAFSGGIDILTRGEVQAIVKNTNTLATLTEWNLQETYWATRQNVHANRAGLFYADLIYRMLTDHDPHPQLFDAFGNALGSLDVSGGGGLDGVKNANPQAGGEWRDWGNWGGWGGIPLVTLRFLWCLLSECGYRPELWVDAESGRPLDEEAATLAFHPVAGGMVADTGEDDRWRVRRETVKVLRELEKSESPPVTAHAQGDVVGEDGLGDEGGNARRLPSAGFRDVERAGHLLATYVRHLLGDEPPTMRFVFGER